MAEGHDDLESDGGIEGAFVGMWGGGCKIVLGGGFKYFLFSSLFGEMIQFD